MKKFIFCLLAIGMTVFASASNLKVSKFKTAIINKEKVLKTKSNDNYFVTCRIQTSGGWVSLTHRGSYSDCIHELIKLLYEQ